MSAALSTPPKGFGHSPNPPARGRRTYCGRFSDSPAPDSRGLRFPIIFWFENRDTESTEDTEKNGKALCSLSALWLITYTNIPFSYRGCAKQLSPFRSRKKKSVACCPPFIKCGALNLKVYPAGMLDRLRAGIIYFCEGAEKQTIKRRTA